MAPVITRTQLENAARDADDLGKTLNDPALSSPVVPRTGTPFKNIHKVIEDIQATGDAVNTYASEQADRAEAAYNATLALAIPLNTQPQGRLSLLSGTALSTSDITGATSIYYVPSGGNYVPIYDGTLFVAKAIGTQLVFPLDNNAAHTLYQQAAKMFDLWAFMDGTTLKLGNGPNWQAGAVAGSNILRGTGAGSTEFEVFNGVKVNKNSMQIRWGANSGDITTVAARRATLLGSFYPLVNGQATDHLSYRLLSNAYNFTERLLNDVVDPTASWVYNTAAFRPANNNTGAKASFIQCLPGAPIRVRSKSKFTSSGVTVVTAGAGIALDGVGIATDFFSVNNTRYEIGWVYLDTTVSAGYHEIAPLEYGAGTADNQTWLGNFSKISSMVSN